MPSQVENFWGRMQSISVAYELEHVHSLAENTGLLKLPVSWEVNLFSNEWFDKIELGEVQIQHIQLVEEALSVDTMIVTSNP